MVLIDKKYIEKELFTCLIEKVKNLNIGKYEIQAGKFTLIFRYCTVEVGYLLKEEAQFARLDPAANNDDVIALVFDVKGLSEKYITQVEFRKTEKEYIMYILPKREESIVNSFISSLCA